MVPLRAVEGVRVEEEVLMPAEEVVGAELEDEVLVVEELASGRFVRIRA